MTTNHQQFLSIAAESMRESAIRRTGAVLGSRRDIISFAPGYPAPDTFPWNEFGEIAAELLGGREAGVLQYGPTRGYRPLLETIVSMMEQRGITTKLEDLLVTTGSQQGLDLVARVLVDPGDVILIELPTYVGALSAFRNGQARLVGVPLDADGIDLAALDAICERVRREGGRVKFLYVVPNFQNPTGLLLGLEKRQRLLAWAEHRDVLIVEDDPYNELYFEDSAAAADVYEACRRGVLARQLPILRAHYAHKRDVMEQALRRELGTDVSWPRPKGGFFLWLTLAAALDADKMIPRAVEHGVIYVAGAAFYVNGEGHNTLRLSFSAPPPERIEAGISRLALTVRAESEALATAAATAAPEAS